MQTLAFLAGALSAGRLSSRALVDRYLERAGDVDGSGVFIRLNTAQARSAADAYDALRASGIALPRYAGIPLSVKDLFDLAGETTLAGSVLLRNAPPASADAVCIARLRAAGFIVLGRTNMTEFAFSGVGLNPHYGTPLNPWDRPSQRIPGGSSSGAAVSVAADLCAAAIGTDTGGSCRIPAALCGIVGYKPTARRVSTTGTYPLSTTLDSIGPLAHSVDCCAILDGVMSGHADVAATTAAYPVSALRLAVLDAYVTEQLDQHVAASYSRALQKLAAAGARLTDIRIAALEQLSDMNARGGISAAEALAHHQQQLSQHKDQYDPRVAARILRARQMSAAEYVSLLARRAAFIKAVSSQIATFDAVLMPTTPLIAPPLAELSADEGYWRINGLMLRNTSIVNMLDGCAITLPCHDPGSAPVGLSLFASALHDARLFAVARAVEACLLPRAVAG